MHDQTASNNMIMLAAGEQRMIVCEWEIEDNKSFYLLLLINILIKFGVINWKKKIMIITYYNRNRIQHQSKRKTQQKICSLKWLKMN